MNVKNQKRSAIHSYIKYETANHFILRAILKERLHPEPGEFS